MNSTRLLVLFDIDGTLLISHGIGRKAIRHALLEVFGIEGALDSQKVGGRSYREIVAGALGGTGITADQISSRWEPFNRAVEQAMREPINQKPGLITALPGGLRLIEVLSSDSCVITGLLTGNPPGVSRLKLESAGFSMQSFQVAVFGDDAETPPQMVALAQQQALERYGQDCSGRRTILVGDTVYDIEPVQQMNARSLIVLTGYDPPETILQARPDHLLDDLTDIEQVKSLLFAPLKDLNP